MNKKIVIHIATKNRATELALLLQSLRTQTFQDFNILILSDGCSVPLTNFYFINYIINRLKLEGHNVTMINNKISAGVSGARQQLVDYSMERGKEELILRIDDDSLAEPDYIEKLLDGIEQGFDLMSGVVPNLDGPNIVRDTKFVEPIIGYCELNDKGELTYMGDDCGMGYTDEKILLTPHFRSSCLYRRELHSAGVDYKSRLSKHGFLEEAIFSFKAIIKGFKLGVNTGAVNYHLCCPSGGERDTADKAGFNMQVFKDTVQRMYEQYGDFLKTYYDSNDVESRKLDPDEYIKSTNLVNSMRK